VTQPLTANATRTFHYKMNTADSSTHTYTQFTTQNLLAFCNSNFSPLRHHGRELLVHDPQAAHCVLTLLPAHAACRMCAVTQILFVTVK